MLLAIPFVQEHAAWIALLEGLGGIGVLGGLLYRFIECQHPGCKRIGRHPMKHLRLCAKHHADVPDEGVTAEHIAEVARAASVRTTPERSPDVTRNH
jgi:hypothetical protein